MTVLFFILIALACIVLGFIILVQNPKGGGLSGNIAGIGNQFMGVKQTTDVLEKGTWIFAGMIAILCIFSTLFIKGGGEAGSSNKLLQDINTTAPASAPSVPANTAPAPTGDTPSK